MKHQVIQTGDKTLALGNTGMEVEIILASEAADRHANNPPIFTIRARYPRIIHAEVMTHRVFGRNARSSRAVPVKRMLGEIQHNPFVPWHWGKNQKGMQAVEGCNEFVCLTELFPHSDEDDLVTREEAWLRARDAMMDLADSYMRSGYHKQIANRLLEPFMFIDVLITSTEWSNFFWLRNHKDAEPHLQDLARLIQTAMELASFQQLAPGEWHLPYITAEDRAHANMSFGATLLGKGHPAKTELLKKISAARCARISYAPFDGDASYERELERYNTLVRSDRIHASPLEHQAMPDVRNSRGEWAFPHLHGNLQGWIQNRKSIPGENRAVSNSHI